MKTHEFTFDERMNVIHSSIKNHLLRVLVQSYEEAIDLIQRAAGSEGIPIEEHKEAMYLGHWDDLKVLDITFDEDYADDEIFLIGVTFTVPPTKIDAISKRDEHVFMSKSFNVKE